MDEPFTPTIFITSLFRTNFQFTIFLLFINQKFDIEQRLPLNQKCQIIDWRLFEGVPFASACPWPLLADAAALLRDRACMFVRHWHKKNKQAHWPSFL